MTVREIQEEIIRLKKEKNICILAHAYQRHDIWDVADYIGDSFGLSQRAAESSSDTVIMCGVRFMAETVKILSPEKKVYLANPTALCPMAEMADRETVRELKKAYPGFKVVAYINTTAETKTECDVCVTSSSAVKIINRLDSDKILFIPDCNLGDYVKNQVSGKEFKFIRGGCPTHLRITKRDIENAKLLHPEALILVHPECSPAVTALSDFAGSTTEIISFAEKSDKKEFIIGTENSITEHLQFSCPDKRFYPLSKECVCHNMAATTLVDVLDTVKGTGGEEIILSEETRLKAKKSIDEMLRLGR